MLRPSKRTVDNRCRSCHYPDGGIQPPLLSVLGTYLNHAHSQYLRKPASYLSSLFLAQLNAVRSSDQLDLGPAMHMLQVIQAANHCRREMWWRDTVSNWHYGTRTLSRVAIRAGHMQVRSGHHVCTSIRFPPRTHPRIDVSFFPHGRSGNGAADVVRYRAGPHPTEGPEIRPTGQQMERFEF